MSDRRELILEAAERLLKHYGWTKTTVADIAREAHIGVGTVYLEFKSKDAIITELSGEKYGHVLRAMRRAAMRPAAFELRLAAMMDARAERFWALGEVGEHGVDLLHCGCNGVKRALTRFERAQRELLVDFLSEAHEADAFHIPHPDCTAQAILTAYRQFAPPWIYHLDAQRARPLLDELHRVVTSGLLTR